MKIKKLCMAGLFCALAIASTYIMHIKVMFLTFDAKDAVIANIDAKVYPFKDIAYNIIDKNIYIQPEI